MSEAFGFECVGGKGMEGGIGDGGGSGAWGLCRRWRVAVGHCHRAGWRISASGDGGALVVGLNPPMGIDRQHESWEARSLYLSALQLARALRLEFVGRAT
jgi:hypothetical protein